jgi:hypothetical protein
VGGEKGSWVVYASLTIQFSCKRESWAPLTNDVHQDIGPSFLQQGTTHVGDGGSLQVFSQVHQLPILSQEGNGCWEGIERLGGDGALAWGPSAPSVQTFCLLTFWGNLPSLLQVGSESHQAAPGVHKLPAAGCEGGAEVSGWDPFSPHSGNFPSHLSPPQRSNKDYGVRSVPRAQLPGQLQLRLRPLHPS